jgi:pimeloyl-ACP methyl ester carboxylesterase
MKLPEGWQESLIETNGVRLHVVTAGNPGGKPVVLLHGFPEFWYGWRRQIPALAAAGYRVIVPDQRGYNLSEVPKGVRAYRSEELVADVLGLLDHFGYERVRLAGHDWGAAVAWSLAIHHPDRLEKLAILNVPHTDVMWQTIRSSPRQLLKSWYIGFFQIPGLADGLLRMGNFAGAVRLLRSSGRAGTFSEADLEEYRQAWNNSVGLTGMINWYRAAVRYRSHSSVDRRVHVPVLILWGRRDVALSAGMAQGSLELCDDGRLVYFDDATHWVQHNAAQAVNRELIAFFGK